MRLALCLYRRTKTNSKLTEDKCAWQLTDHFPLTVIFSIVCYIDFSGPNGLTESVLNDSASDLALISKCYAWRQALH